MKKLNAAALAIALVGGVYLTSGEAHASNMGFKLNYEIPVLDGALTGSQNFAYLAYPYFNGMGDVGTETPIAPGGDDVPCASMTGTFTPDGVITLADAICDTWTLLPTLTGSELASVQYIDVSDCSFVALALNVSPFFGASFGGATGVELTTIRDIGVLFQLTQSAPGMNTPVIVGSHDPSYTGYVFQDPAVCAQTILSPVYHGIAQTTTEIFCGIEGTDWVDMDLDGVPDTCDGGIWDGATFFSIQTYSNDAGGFIGFQAATIREFFMTILLPSDPLPLQPGSGYLLSLEPGSMPNDWVQAHF
ncbi:MAG: hypothetical protein AAF533_06990 [Acidobacteriota bacterium]